jgi:hypothetical protein
MAKKKIPRKKRAAGQKKPEPLPKSVQALLRYLGGSDVKVASSARRPAVIPSQFPLQQEQIQQQQQQQQPRQRKKTSGQVIAASPLSQLAPAPQLPAELTPEQKKARLEAEAKAKVKAEAKQKGKEEATAKVEQLEQSLTSFKQQAGQVAVALSESIRKTLKSSQHYEGQDYDPLDSEAEFSANAKPYVAEQGLQVSTAAPAMARAQSVPTRQSGIYVPPEIEAGQGAYAASQYVQAVSNPELTPRGSIKGRAKLTEQQKAANAEARRLAKETKKELLKTAGQTLYQEGQSATKALEELTLTIKEKKAAKPRTKSDKKPAIPGGVDPATQIQFLAGGGAAAQQATQPRGKSVLEMLGGTNRQ